MSIPQSYTEFEATLEKSNPPTHWPEALQALWFQAKGDWEASHNIAQDLHTAMGSLIHAHLHRDEGDDWNAKYWYRQAGRPFPQISLAEELKLLINETIAKTKP